MSKFNFPKEEQFINCMYSFPNNRGKEKIPDYILLVTKDKNNKKHLTTIPNPEYSFYITNDTELSNKQHNFIDINKCKKITCRYNNRYNEMAKASTSKETKQFYKRCIDSKDWKRLNQLHLQPEFHASDIDICDYYIARFLDENDYQKYNYGIDILAFDIEVDGSDYIGFPDEKEAPCEVSMITAFDISRKRLYIFAKKYDTDTFNEFYENKLKEDIEAIKNEYKEEFPDMKVIPKFFDKEILLIAYFFKLVNSIKPDYVLSWNLRFDFQTLLNRLIKICPAYKTMPEYVMCPEEFPVKYVKVKLDNSPNAETDYANRVDNFQIFGYSNWIDMMCLYANITKPNGKEDSYELDYIGEKITGKNKVDLADQGYNIKTVHLENYSLFYKYASVDSLLLGLIIKKTGFVELLHTIVTMTRTRPTKALKKTVSERNFGEYFYNISGYTISNNHSSLVSKNGKIKGAYVAYTSLIDRMGSINGVPSNKVLGNVIDMDLSALYPSIDIAYNIASDTMRYKIIVIDNTIKPNEDNDHIVTDQFFENYISNDNINYGKKYHGLPDIKEMYELLSMELSA